MALLHTATFTACAFLRLLPATPPAPTVQPLTCNSAPRSATNHPGPSCVSVAGATPGVSCCGCVDLAESRMLPLAQARGAGTGVPQLQQPPAAVTVAPGAMMAPAKSSAGGSTRHSMSRSSRGCEYHPGSPLLPDGRRNASPSIAAQPPPGAAEVPNTVADPFFHRRTRAAWTAGAMPYCGCKGCGNGAQIGFVGHHSNNVHVPGGGRRLR